MTDKMESAQKDALLEKAENKEQNAEYEKARHDCWNLDAVFLDWLYLRLEIYREEAFKVIDGTYYKFVIDGKERTQEECVTMIIDLLTPSYEIDWDGWKLTEQMIADTHKAISIFNEILFSLWW